MRHFAFLRALNVGGHNVITMAALRKAFVALGLKDAETFITSGNVIFSSGATSQSALARKISAHLAKSLGYAGTVVLRNEAELSEIVRYKPFSDAELRAAHALSVALLEAPVGRSEAKGVMALTTDVDAFHVHGREVYWLCAAGQRDSKFSGARFERVVKAPGTFRNMNTIARLAARYIRAR